LLPGMDQTTVYNQYNRSGPQWDPSNATAIAAKIPAFVCPSTPRNGGTINITCNATSSKNGLGSGTFAIDNTGGSGLNLTGGAIDYIVTEKSVGNYRNPIAVNAGYVQQGNRNEGPLGEFSSDITLVANNGFTDRIMSTAIKDVRDGLSNTLLVEEMAGRNQLYRVTRTPVPIQGTDFTDDGFAQYVAGEGYWAASKNTHRHQGSTFDGVTVSGPCGINCSNARVSKGSATSAGGGGGYYSFHPGGIHALLCDGTVRFLNQSISPVTLCALISRDEQDGPLGEF